MSRARRPTPTSTPRAAPADRRTRQHHPVGAALVAAPTSCARRPATLTPPPLLRVRSGHPRMGGEVGGWHREEVLPSRTGTSVSTSTLPTALPTESRAWAAAAHASGVGVAVVSVGILAFVGPLTVWLLRRDEDAYVAHHALEALNFHLTASLVALAAWALAIPTVVVGVLTLGLFFLVAGLVVAGAVVAWVGWTLVATLRAWRGEGHRYPVTLRLVAG
ncbi:DUF4870 domain-containing protein [Nitriliruptoraceae bacterium ZYF776]|nr:DUF4870 domain-containing protein [Profundirhabdus halotolerans]